MTGSSDWTLVEQFDSCAPSFLQLYASLIPSFASYTWSNESILFPSPSQSKDVGTHLLHFFHPARHIVCIGAEMLPPDRQ
jgi:hypothetical protein